MFLFPLILFGMIQMQLSQISCMKQTREFVNTCIFQGEISKELYDDYQHMLSATGLLYEIEIMIKRKNFEPDYRRSSNGSYYFTGEILFYSEDYFGTIQIEEQLHKEGILFLEQGDYVQVDIKNKDRTIGMRLLQGFLPGIPTQMIHIRYGNGV